MGNDIILCMALIASFAFVVQFLLSILGSDLDTDIDIDSASDLSISLSDIISFKGITHFILGLISGKKLPENRLRHLSTLTSEISRYLTAVRTVPVISLTMLSRPSLRHWESLISFRLQIL